MSAHFGSDAGAAAAGVVPSVVRTYDEELSYLTRQDSTSLAIAKGFVPNMRVPGRFYVNEELEKLTQEELRQHSEAKNFGGFIPAVKQIANVAALPGIVGASIGLPDVHAGYGFAIGNVAAFDMSDPEAVVSPGGVGFDINCGVRLLRTNLTVDDVRPVQETLAQSLFDHIPVRDLFLYWRPLRATAHTTHRWASVRKASSQRRPPTSTARLRWAWISRSGKATRGPKTRSTGAWRNTLPSPCPPLPLTPTPPQRGVRAYASGRPE